jgi:hypothetical protein
MMKNILKIAVLLTFVILITIFIPFEEKAEEENNN